MVKARAVGTTSLTTSDEHSRMGFFDPDHLPSPLPDTYRTVIARAVEMSTDGAW